MLCVFSQSLGKKNGSRQLEQLVSMNDLTYHERKSSSLSYNAAGNNNNNNSNHGHKSLLSHVKALTRSNTNLATNVLHNVTGSPNKGQDYHHHHIVDLILVNNSNNNNNGSKDGNNNKNNNNNNNNKNNQLTTTTSGGKESGGHNNVWGRLVKMNKSDGTSTVELCRTSGTPWGFFVAIGTSNNVKGKPTIAH